MALTPLSALQRSQGTSGTPEPLGPASRRPPGLRSPLSPVKPKECQRGAALGAQAPESRGQGHLRVPPRVPGQPEGPRQPGRPQRPGPRLSRASEPRVSPRRDPRRPIPSPPGPRLLPRGEGPPRALQPSPTEAQVALVPHQPLNPSLSLLPHFPSTRDPLLLASPGPPGRPEGPRQPGRATFPLPWPLPPASHPRPSAFLPTGSIRPAGGTPAARCQSPPQPPSLCLQARAPASPPSEAPAPVFCL